MRRTQYQGAWRRRSRFCLGFGEGPKDSCMLSRQTRNGGRSCRRKEHVQSPELEQPCRSCAFQQRSLSGFGDGAVLQLGRLRGGWGSSHLQHAPHAGMAHKRSEAAVPPHILRTAYCRLERSGGQGGAGLDPGPQLWALFLGHNWGVVSRIRGRWVGFVSLGDSLLCGWQPDPSAVPFGSQGV